MDDRTKKLIEDYYRLQQGGDGNQFADIAKDWVRELEAKRHAEKSSFEQFFAHLDTLVLRCR